MKQDHLETLVKQVETILNLPSLEEQTSALQKIDVRLVITPGKSSGWLSTESNGEMVQLVEVFIDRRSKNRTLADEISWWTKNQLPMLPAPATT